MDKLIIEKKLDSLYRCLQRIEEKCPTSVDLLKADLDIQDVMVLNISRAVQLCVDLATHLIANNNQPVPNTMGETFDLLSAQHIVDTKIAQQLKKAVGFRNIAVHNYDLLNWDIVYAIASKQLGDFKMFAKAITRLIEHNK